MRISTKAIFTLKIPDTVRHHETLWTVSGIQ